MITLLRIGLRYHKHHLLQSFLLILGIALGVAVVIAIDLANTSAKDSFQTSVDSVVGKATHQIVGGPSGIEDEFYRKLRIEYRVRKSAPVVHGYVRAVDWKRPIQVLGIDPFAEAPFRSYVTIEENNLSGGVFGDFICQPGTVLLGQELAERENIKKGSLLTLERGAQLFQVRVIGFISPSTTTASQSLQGMMIADIATAQEILGKIGKLSHIDLYLSQENEAEKIREILPPGLSLKRPQVRNSYIAQMIRAFEFNLSALSLMSLIIGMFLIYNTITFSIVQRRSVLGTLRALGVTRKQIFLMILGETFVFGLLGVIFGIGLGIFLGKIVLGFVVQSISDFYYTLTLSRLNISSWSLLKGTVLGVLTALIAALFPAYEAMKTPPTGLMIRSLLEDKVFRYIPRITLGGVFFFALGIGLLVMPSNRIELGFLGLFAIILGSVLFVPLLTVVCMWGIERCQNLYPSLFLKMAARSISRSLSRTTVAIASLMVAVSLIIGVSIMIGSFRNTVESWLQTVLTADIFISTPSETGRLNSFDREIISVVASVKEIKEVATSQTLQLETPTYGMVNLNAVDRDIARKTRLYLWQDGTHDEVYQKLQEGGVIVTEPFAYRHKIKALPGNFIELPTNFGQKRFPVVGISYSYSSDQGIVVMASPVYRKYWEDHRVSGVAAYIHEGENVSAVVAKLEKLFSGRYNFVVQSNRNLRLSALKIFDRTFTITTALRILVALVAFIGILSTVMALLLERTKEFGILRANGMTPGQIFRLILWETSLLGLIAGILSIPLGTIMAAILVYVINIRSFGWTIIFQPELSYYIYTVAIALGAALAAGLYPAWRLQKAKVIQSLRAE